MSSYARATLERLLDGQLGFSEVHSIMSKFKDRDRFEQMLAIHQDRLGWPERLLLPLAEGLFIVELDGGERVVRCACGHDFADYRTNWKLEALVHVRNTQEAIDELYPQMMGCDPEWMELREFFCPGCLRLLEVEAVPPGYPIVFDFEPDLETLYDDWLADGAPPGDREGEG